VTVVDVKVQLFKAHGKEVHDISDVEVEDPVVLVLHAQDRLYVILQLDSAFLAFLKSLLIFKQALVDIIVSRLLSAAHLAMFKHLLWRLLVFNASLFKVFGVGLWTSDSTQIVVLQIRVGVLLGITRFLTSCLLLNFICVDRVDSRCDFEVFQIHVFFDRKFFNNRP